MRVGNPVRSKPVPISAAINEDCTGHKGSQSDSDKVSPDVVLPHCSPYVCVPYPVEGLFKVYENMVEVLMVLKMLLTQDSEIEYLLSGAPSCPKTSLFLSNYLLRLRLKSVQYNYDLQPDFSWVAHETSVVLTLSYLS